MSINIVEARKLERIRRERDYLDKLENSINEELDKKGFNIIVTIDKETLLKGVK